MRTGKLPLAVLRISAIALCVACGTGAAAQIVNPGFDTPNPAWSPPNYLSSRTTSGIQGSSAMSWDLWNQAAGRTSSQLLPTTDPFGGTAPYMIDIVAGSGNSGIREVLPVATVLPSISYDINIISGTVRLIALNAAGSYIGFTQSSILGWQTLTVVPTSQPVARVSMVSVGGPAAFQVDRRGAPVPEPGSLAVLFGALVPAGGLALRRISRR